MKGGKESRLGEHVYLAALDGIRALAVVAVVLRHAASYDNTRIGRIASRGWYGVDTFFVLSGFLITWVLLSEHDVSGNISLSRFYVRRVLRLQPAYFSFIIFSLISFALAKRSELWPMFTALPLFLTYTLNIAAAGQWIGPLPSVEIAWSLCVEEQFYAMWAPVLRRLGAARAFRVAVGTVVFVSLYRCSLYLWMNWGHLWNMSATSFDRIYLAPDTRIDTCLIGCAAALALRSANFQTVWSSLEHSTWFPSAAVAVALTVIWYITGAEPVGGYRAWTVGSTFAATSVAGVILAIFLQPRSWPARLLAFRPLVFVGKISYGIYLFHVLVILAVRRTLHLHGIHDPSVAAELTVLATTLAGSVMVAWLHYRYVESFFLSLRPQVSPMQTAQKQNIGAHPPPVAAEAYR